MKKKQFLQFRRAMATLLAVAMIGQNTVMTTAENYAVDNTAVVAEEQVQEPEAQDGEAASREADPVVQSEGAETAVQVEVPTETPTQETPQVTSAPETPAQETPQVTSAPETQQEESKTTTAPETQPEQSQNDAPADPSADANNGQAGENGSTENNTPEVNPSEDAGKEVLYHVTFDSHAADFGQIQVHGEEAPGQDVVSYNKEVKENDSFAFAVKANEGYEVEYVRFADTQADIQKNADGLYEIPAVTKDEKVTVTYKAVAEEPVAEPTEKPADESAVRENPVTFQVSEGATVTVDGTDVTNGTAMAKDGRIVFSIDTAEGYGITSVLVDGSIPARPNEETEAANDYIIEGISEDTFVVVATQKVVKAEEPEAENNGDSSVSLSDMTADDLYAYLMGLSIQDAWALLENDETVALIESTLSEEQLAAFSGYVWSTDNLMVLAADDLITVSAKTVDDKDLGTERISVGEITCGDIIRDGVTYEFKHAKVDNTVVKIVAQTSDNRYYVTAEDDQLAGTRINASTDITLYFKEKKESRTITYTVKTTENESLSTSDLKDFIGENSVEVGDALEFSFDVKPGYEISLVQVGEKNIVKDENGKYIYNNVQKDLNVIIILKRIKEYTFKFEESSNTVLKYGNDTWYSGTGGSKKYKAFSDSIVFYLECYSQWDVIRGSLNKLTITIDGKKYMIETPPAGTAKEGDTKTQILPNGISVTWTCKGYKEVPKKSADDQTERGMAAYYEVTLTSTNGIYGDIIVSTNYKTYSSSEVWIKELNGIESPVYVTNGVSSKKLQPDVFAFFDRTNVTYSETKIWFNVAQGYSKKTEDITATLMNNGVSEPLTVNSGDNGGYKYYVTVPADGEKVYQDVRIYLTAKPIDEKYVVRFEYGNGKDKPLTMPTEYQLNSNFAVKDGKGYPTRDGYTFAGWELDDIVYKPGKIFTISDLTKGSAIEEDNKYVFVFKAKWIADGETDEIYYSVNVYFEKEDGSYPASDEPNADFSEMGVKGNEIFIIQSQIQKKLNSVNSKLPKDWNTAYELDETKSVQTIQLVEKPKTKDDNVLKLYYCRKKDVVIKSATDSWTYDGNIHKAESYTVEYDGNSYQAKASGDGNYKVTLPNGDSLVITPETTGVRNVSDTGTNKFKYVLENEAGYKSVNVESGTLTITPKRISIAGNTAIKPYTGDYQSVTGYTPITLSAPTATIQLSGKEAVATGKDAREQVYPMGLKKGDFIIKEDGIDSTNNYEINYVDGWLKITPAAETTVNITGHTDTVTYDGKSHTVKDYDVEKADDSITVTVNEGVKAEASGTDVGKYNMGLKEADFTASSPNYSKVNVKVTDGWLEITPAKETTVNITGHTGTVTYDGKSHTVKDYDVEKADDSITLSVKEGVKAEASGTDVGKYNMGLKEADFTASSPNYSKVNVEVTDGWLEITPIKEKVTVKISGKIKTEVYDGKEKYVNGYDVTSTDNELYTAECIAFSGKAEAKGTDAGKYDMNISAKDFANVSENFTDVEFIVEDGYLEITPVMEAVVVTITGNQATYKYDGSAKSAEDYTVAISNELFKESDISFTGNKKAEGTNAGTYTVKLVPGQFKNENKNFGNVTFEVVRDIQLTISKRSLTFTSASDSKAYDGTPLTAQTVNVTGDGFVKGEGATYNVTGTLTEVGSIKNDYGYTLNKGTDSKNYDIQKEYGTLTVTTSADEIVVNIKGHTQTVLYDGSEKTVKGYEVTHISNSLYTEKDFQFKGTDEVKGTNANTYYMGLKDTDFVNISENFDNEKVTFIVEDGYLDITPRSILLTSASASKVYDGTTLTAQTVNVTGDGFAEGEGATYNVTGSQLNEGFSDNFFTYSLKSDTKPENYKIETKPGRLTVDPVTAEVVVTITENSETVDYDGTEQSVTGYTVTKISNPVYTEKDFTISENASQTVYGVDADTYNMELKPEDFKNINSNFKDVKFEIIDGTLTIKPLSITIEAASATKKYDGVPLTNAEYKIVKGLVAEGQTVHATVAGSQTLVGSSPNKVTEASIFAEIDKEVIDVTRNYVITNKDGELKVTDGTDDPVDRKKVVTKNHDDSKSYDLGDTVTFEISVTNIYDTAKNITITELPGVVINSESETPNVLTLKDVPKGETIKVTATYVITEADITKGSFTNTVKVEFEGGKPFEDTDTVITVDPVRSYTLTKTASQSTHENGMFKAGETIHYTITVTNTGNQTLTNVEITDTLNAAGTISNIQSSIQGIDSKQDGKVTTFTISTLAPKAEAKITYDYVVQEADKGNTISNAAVGTPADPADPDGKKPEGGTENPVENPKLEVKKDVVSITAADGTQKDKAGKADAGDIITYSVTVTNTGNVKLANAKITDSLEGIQLTDGQSFDIGTLEAGKAKTVTYTYQVKESDLGKSILNTATATADVPEDPDGTPKPGAKDEKEVPTEDPANCSITVTKRLTNLQGELLAVRAADFYVTLFSNEAMTQKAAETRMIHFDENQGTSSVTFDQLKRGTYYVAETDAEGKVMANGTYNNGSFVPQYQSGNKVEITENGTAAQFQFDNQFLILPDEFYIVKTITITKSVVKKNGEDLKSNETFYAGIFKDENCTELADMVSQNIVPLAMNGEAETTASVEVTVPVGGESVTLYVTEVTADGTPVALSDSFEYDAEITDGLVTLSETSEDAAVIILNTSKKEEPVDPEPTEKPAEPTREPQITQQPEERAASTNAVKTGDDSPLSQLAFMLLAASAAILLIVIFRKRDKKDMMK